MARNKSTSSKIKPNVSSVIRLKDFSGGKNSTISPTLLNDNEATEALNVSFEQKGTISPHKGRKQRYGLVFSSSPSTGIGAYYKKDGTSRLLTAAGTEVYADEPHLEKKWDTKADWEQGTLGSRVSTTDVEGDLVLDVGQEQGIASTSGEATGGSADATYGWSFTPTKNIRVYALRTYGVLTNKEYTVTIWKDLDKSKVKEVTFTNNTTNNWTVTKFYASPVELNANESYRVSIHCLDANFMKYWTGGSVNTLLVYGAAYHASGKAYPETVNPNKFFGCDLEFDVIDFSQDFDTQAEFDTGTKDGVTTLSEGSVEMVITGNDLDVSETTQADFSTGTLTNVFVEAEGNLCLESLRWSAHQTTQWSAL